MMHNMIGHQEGVSIFCGIGERCREGEELYRDMKEAGVLPNMVMVFGQMNEPPGSRFRVGDAALTMAEYFRDDEHHDVLLLIDNIFRFIQADMEVSGLMGQMPSRLGYQPTLGTELSRLEERIGVLAELPWPTKSLPEVMGSGTATLRALIREYLFVSLFRACAESLASENASRLAAMQRADKNIEELLEDLNRTFHRLRQDGIDEELFDVISGFEALSVEESKHE